MALTRNFKETVQQRVQSDASFAKALLDEAATLFLNGEPETARLILRDLVNAVENESNQDAVSEHSRAVRLMQGSVEDHGTCQQL